MEHPRQSQTITLLKKVEQENEHFLHNTNFKKAENKAVYKTKIALQHSNLSSSGGKFRSDGYKLI